MIVVGLDGGVVLDVSSDGRGGRACFDVAKLFDCCEYRSSVWHVVKVVVWLYWLVVLVMNEQNK